MSGGKSRQSEIDKISSSTKKAIQKLVKSQLVADKKAGKAQARDTQLLRQQLETDNANTAAMQGIYNQQLTQQSEMSNQYAGGLQSQLDLLRNQNSLLSTQAAQQTEYQASMRQFQDQQNALNLQQQQRAQEEANYGTMLEAQQAQMAASTANRLTQQVNRRRSLQRMGQVARR